MKSDLVKLIKKIYSEDTSYRGSPPWQLIQGLEKNRLVISDIETVDEDIPVLIKFFQTKQACKEVEVIEVNRTCGASVYRRRNKNSALNSNDHKLMKELLQFVAKCQHLQMLTFHNVKLGVAFMSALGKALVSSPNSELRWLVFRKCQIGGDVGLRAITPALCALPLQVLAIEECQLTDVSWSYVHSVLKARESSLDDLYWNSTLRTQGKSQKQANGAHGHGVTGNGEEGRVDGGSLAQGIDVEGLEDKSVLGEGLVAISLRGNLLTGDNMQGLCSELKKAFWLLGLNLADNRLSAAAIEQLLGALRANEILQVLLMRGNPGVQDEGNGSNGSRLTSLYQTIVSRLGDGAAGTQSASHGMVTGYMRINLLAPRVSWLLRVWRELLYEEAMGGGREEKAYSGLDFCLEPSLSQGPRGGGRGGDGDGDGAGASQAENGEAVLYDIADNGGGGTTKLVHTPFHDYLFSTESGAVQGTLVSSLDISDGAEDEAAGGLEDDLGLPSSHSKLDSHPPMDWEYWPEEGKNARSGNKSNNGRPPSRVSMRPQSKSQSARPSTSPSVIKRKGGAVVQPTTTL
eukprot:gene38655-46991_t